MQPVSQGFTIPAERLGPLEDSTSLLDNPAALRDGLATAGYVYLPGYLPREDVLAARREVFGRLASVDEIGEPVTDGIHTGRSRRAERHPDLGAFWRSVAESWALRRLTHGRHLNALMSTLLARPAIAQDFLFLRPAGPGKFTNIHCDYGFFTRCTEDVLTAWIALGDVPVCDGPLFVVENSHRFNDLIEAQRGFDVARDTHRKAALPDPPLEFLQQRDSRMLTGDFSAGDVVVFSMFTFHGTLDNISPDNRVRLSVDVRFQPADAPRDPRYFGPDPTGTTGAGYGELTGAKPLTADWHVR